LKLALYHILNKYADKINVQKPADSQWLYDNIKAALEK